MPIDEYVTEMAIFAKNVNMSAVSLMHWKARLSFFIHITPILAQGLPGLPSFWKSQRRLNYYKNSLWVRKQRWNNIFHSLWSRWAEIFKQIFQWCTIWIMLSEFVPQIRRDGKPQLWSALFFLIYSFASMKVITENLPPFCSEAFLHATQLRVVFHHCGCLSSKWQTLLNAAS